MGGKPGRNGGRGMGGKPGRNGGRGMGGKPGRNGGRISLHPLAAVFLQQVI